MPVDFRDGKTFPRRGREPLGEFLWLARVFDKARAKASQTQDGYIYPCPMDRAMFKRWGVAPNEFTIAVRDKDSDDRIVAWMAERVAPGQRQAANEWLLRQTSSLDRQDAEEGVPGAVAPLPWRDIGIGIALAAVTWMLALLILRPHHP